MTINEKVKIIIEKSEESLLKYNHDFFIKKLFCIHFVYPFKYLKSGSNNILIPFHKWVFYMSILMIPYSFFIENHLSSQNELITTTIFVCIATFLALFTIPSTYAFYGIKNDKIQNVIDVLKSLKISNIHELKMIENILEKNYERIMQKINTFKWIVGSYWFIFTFIKNMEMQYLRKISNHDFEYFFNTTIKYELMGIIFITLLLIWLIISYKRVSDILFKSIEFGIIEYKQIIYNNESNSEIKQL